MRQRALDPLVAIFTIPALALFLELLIYQTMSGDQIVRSSTVRATYRYLPLLSGFVWISPIFIFIQVWLMSSRRVAATWQNMLCVALTAIGAVLMWASVLGWGG